MKQFKLLATLFMAVLTMSAVCACSSDDDDEGGGGAAPKNLIGTWYGTNGTWNFWYTFKSDGTGSGEGHSKRGSELHWAYSYTCSGNTIKCKGSRGGVDFGGTVEMNENWSTTFTLNGSTLSGGDFRDVTFEKQ